MSFWYFIDIIEFQLMININYVWKSVINLYKVCIAIKKVDFYFFLCFKAFLVYKGEDKIMIFENAVPFNKNIDSKERWQSNCLIYLNAEKSM